MIPPKEKAEELCFKFQGDFELNWTMSKRCALITVDEILNESILFWNKDYQYWIEVKNEIEKL